MEQESKVILGLKKGKYFTDPERHQIIQEYLNGYITKQSIWEKYTGQVEEHGQLLRWMRQLGYDEVFKTRRPKFALNPVLMNSHMATKDSSEESFENLQLKKRIAELEAQLKDAEMKAIAYSTMVDIAEKELNIAIRKKYNTKPLKK